MAAGSVLAFGTDASNASQEGLLLAVPRWLAELHKHIAMRLSEHGVVVGGDDLEDRDRRQLRRDSNAEAR